MAKQLRDMEMRLCDMEMRLCDMEMRLCDMEMRLCDMEKLPRNAENHPISMKTPGALMPKIKITIKMSGQNSTYDENIRSATVP
jgi:hypothetical protein